jgi:hypothetical protein
MLRRIPRLRLLVINECAATAQRRTRARMNGPGATVPRRRTHYRRDQRMHTSGVGKEKSMISIDVISICAHRERERV